MGYTWEVQAYLMFGDGEYQYVTSYTGESLVKALFDMWKCKRNDGCGCVRLYWR